jgi:hypothetical protein
MRAIAHGGLVAQVPALTLYEGKRAVIIYPDGTVQELSMKTVEAKATIDKKDLAAGGPELLAKAMRELGGGIGDQMEKDLSEVMKKVDPRHGGTFGGEDDEAMFQDLIEGLRKMDMSFDDDGTPSIFFVTSPENTMKLQSLNTPERQKAFDELVEEKRREWRSRESHRRLVN